MERTAPGISELFFYICHTSRRAETDDFPELLIPFYITKDEAVDILGKWCRSHAGKAEAKLLKDHLSEMTGVYLPYEIAKGPVTETVNRNSTRRKLNVRGL